MHVPAPRRLTALLALCALGVMGCGRSGTQEAITTQIPQPTVEATAAAPEVTTPEITIPEINGGATATSVAPPKAALTPVASNVRVTAAPPGGDPATTTAPMTSSCVLGPEAVCAGADLAGADLSGAVLPGIDLSGANL